MGKIVEVFFAETISLSDAFEVEKLSPEQKSIINKVIQTIKEELAKKKIESITFGFPQLVSIKIVNKEDTETKSK